MSTRAAEGTRRRLAAGVFTILLALIATACGGSDGPDVLPPTSAPASARPSSSATLEIVSPKQNQVITETSATVDVKLKGAEIVPQTSTDLQPDQGHLHVILDDALVSMTSGTETDLTGLTPGQHLLKVEFVANDHAPFDPRVIAAVTFEVEA